MGLLNVFAGAMSAGANKVQEALATEQKAMTARMLEESRQGFENKRQEKMLSANRELMLEGQKFQAAENKETRAQAITLFDKAELARYGQELRAAGVHKDDQALQMSQFKDTEARLNKAATVADKNHREQLIGTIYTAQSAAYTAELKSLQVSRDKILSLRAQVAALPVTASDTEKAALTTEFNLAQTELKRSEALVAVQKQHIQKFGSLVEQRLGFKIPGLTDLVTKDVLPPTNSTSSKPGINMGNFGAQPSAEDLGPTRASLPELERPATGDTDIPGMLQRIGKGAASLGEWGAGYSPR